MSSVNKVTILGNLGADPDIRTMQNGKPVCNLSVATSESWKDRDGNKQERTEWHRVVIFSEGLCGVAEKYLRKGSKVYIEGKLQTRKWQADDGTDRYSTEIILQGFNSSLVMLGGKNSDAGGSSSAYRESAASYDQSPIDSNDFDDEIPF